MKSLFIAPILALSIALSGCANVPGGGPVITIPPITLPPIVTTNPAYIKFIEFTKKGCQWEPTFETVTSIIAAIGGFSIATDVIFAAAQQACALVNRAGVNRFGVRSVPKLYGVPLRGNFVK